MDGRKCGSSPFPPCAIYFPPFPAGRPPSCGSSRSVDDLRLHVDREARELPGAGAITDPLLQSAWLRPARDEKSWLQDGRAARRNDDRFRNDISNAVASVAVLVDDEPTCSTIVDDELAPGIASAENPAEIADGLLKVDNRPVGRCGNTRRQSS